MACARCANWQPYTRDVGSIRHCATRASAAAELEAVAVVLWHMCVTMTIMCRLYGNYVALPQNLPHVCVGFPVLALVFPLFH